MKTLSNPDIYRVTTVQAMNRTISKKIVRPKKYSEKVVDEIHYLIALGLVIAMNIPLLKLDPIVDDEPAVEILAWDDYEIVRQEPPPEIPGFEVEEYIVVKKK